MAFDCIFHYLSVYREAFPQNEHSQDRIVTYGHCFLGFTDVLFIKCCRILFHFSDKSFNKAFAIFENDSMYPNIVFCSSTTCCFTCQSNDKDCHPGIMMSSGVRKRKWHNLCVTLYTIFLFQKFNTEIVVVYSPQKKKCITIFWKVQKV